jgi:dihydropteroate synthase
LNVTPDSFSDGGRFNTPETAATHAKEMVAAGADILDIGAQSTRPGAALLSAEEEWTRLEPCLKAVRVATDCPLSVDTFHPEVAARALAAGAHIINDISGSEQNGMAAVAAQYGAGLICMRPGDPAVRDVPADTVVAETAAYFQRALALADAAGLPREALCLDVGVGFGSSPAGDLALIARLRDILPPVPVLVGASRKRVVADVCGDLPAAERLPGTIALHTVALWNGAHILRVHDVAETVQAAQVITALRKEYIYYG